ncbi:MAG: RDD family protein [Actinomycetota bacterium]
MRTEERSAGAGPAERFAYAGFWARTGALAIDVLVTTLWALPFRSAFRAVASDPAVLGPFRVSGLVVLAVFWAYLVVTTAATGGTLGKHAMRIRVVGTGFQRPDWATVLFREVVGRVIVAASAGIGYLWAAFDGRKQGWHDKIADTLVLRRVAVVDADDPWLEDPVPPRPGGRHRSDG